MRSEILLSFSKYLRMLALCKKVCVRARVLVCVFLSIFSGSLLCVPVFP